jgi:hypothetical protein
MAFSEKTKPTETTFALTIRATQDNFLTTFPPQARTPPRQETPMSPELARFLKSADPKILKELANAAVTSTRVDGTIIRMDDKKLTTDVNKTVGTSLSDNGKRELVAFVAIQYGQAMSDAGLTSIKEGYEKKEEGAKKKDDALIAEGAAQVGSGLAMGAAGSQILAQGGQGTIDQNGAAFLKKAGAGLSEEQRQDMLRGAAAAGFSDTAIAMASRSLFGARERGALERGENAADIALQNWTIELLRNRMTEITQKMQDLLAQQSEGKLANEKAKREYEALYEKLEN